jgi:thiol-disulfide isomerase/thioredoxin
MPATPGVLLGAMTPGLAVLAGAIAIAVIGGIGWRLANGRMRSVDAAARSAAAEPEQGLVLTSDQLGHPLGEQATLVQFSSAFCAPCRATRRILAEVAAMTQGVAHVEIDAESRLDLVRELNVLRTPTVLVLAGDGQVVRRASGQPRKPDVIAAIGTAVARGSARGSIIQ